MIKGKYFALGSVVLILLLLLVFSGNSSLSQGRLTKNPKALPAYDENKCYDSDGGKNYEEQGTIYGKINKSKFGNKTDSCNSRTQLTEYYCDGKYVKSEKYSCENGCSTGACKKNEEHQLLVIFTYTDEKLPQDVKETIIGDYDNKNSLKYAEKWVEKEAKKYNSKFRLKLSFFDEDIKIPSKYLDESKNSIIKNNQEFKKYLSDNYPEISNYESIAIVIYDSPSSYVSTPHVAGLNMTISVISKYGEGLYNPPLDSSGFVETFIHEFFHLFGALDKYESNPSYSMLKGCRLDEFGQEYDGFDLFCHRIIENKGEMVSVKFPEFEELIISEPTAVEIRWIFNPNILKDSNCPEIPEIIDVIKVYDEEKLYVSVLAQVCQNHLNNEYKLISFEKDSISYYGSESFPKKLVGIFVFIDKSTNSYFTICKNIENLSKESTSDKSVCGNVIEFNPVNFTFKEVGSIP